PSGAGCRHRDGGRRRDAPLVLDLLLQLDEIEDAHLPQLVEHLVDRARSHLVLLLLGLCLRGGGLFLDLLLGRRPRRLSLRRRRPPSSTCPAATRLARRAPASGAPSRQSPSLPRPDRPPTPETRSRWALPAAPAANPLRQPRPPGA